MGHGDDDDLLSLIVYTVDHTVRETAEPTPTVDGIQRVPRVRKVEDTIDGVAELGGEFRPQTCTCDLLVVEGLLQIPLGWVENSYLHR